MANLDFQSTDQVLTVNFSGTWTLKTPRPKLDLLLNALHLNQKAKLVLNSQALESWDNSLLICCREIISAANRAFEQSEARQIDFSGLDMGLQKLLRLSNVTAPQKKSEQQKLSFFAKIGEQSLDLFEVLVDVFAFLGQFFESFARFLIGRCRYAKSDLWLIMRQCGIDALPIVSLTALLLGLIFAFIGSVQLKMFGAEIYVAGGVTLTMVRVMGAVMTGIVLSGRTGASFAALIGTMQVNEEIDALKSFGIDPMDFIVLPRVVALAIMTPLLTLYAIVLGLFGGFLVGVFLLDLSPIAYFDNAKTFFYLNHLWIGLFHAFIFGIIIALTGCYQGINCGRSAEDVGQVTTSAVVISIVGIIVATSIITVITTIVPI